jgi:hypothetical protein
MFISCSLAGMVVIKTTFKIGKIGNVDVMMMMVKCYSLILWGFQRGHSWQKEMFCTYVGLSCHIGFRTFTNRESSNFIIIDTMSILLILNILTTVLINTTP